MFSDTIVAIATPVGEGAIGILRLSGPSAVELASVFFKPAGGTSLERQLPRKLCAGLWVDRDGRVLDEVLCVRFQAPHSYTGEDVVEVHAHGGAFHLSLLLHGLLEAGARLARPGEFTQRAFLNGRMDLTRAEAVADLIRAGAELSCLAAARQLAGELGRAVEALRQGALEILAALEAGIDFPEEEAQLPPRHELAAKASDLLDRMRALLATARQGRMAAQGIRVVLAGSPNAGKSSLLNALVGEARSIVSEAPGTTRDYIEARISLKGFPVVLIDTAGLREVQDPVEREGVRRSLSLLRESDVTVLVLDRSRGLCEEDWQVLELSGGETVLAANKSDLHCAWDLADLPKRALNLERVAISCRSGQGLAELKEAILKAALKGRAAGLPGEALLTQARHEDAMRRAAQRMETAAGTLSNPHVPLELASGDLRAAADALGEILGKTVREDILNEIFEKFCIGK